ncbi:MAG: IS5 family transposase, partial [Thiomargarita sp.]|nr:IS5 family transposase [Thiomargarita sp.]
VELMELPIKVPDYTTLSRRQSKLAVEIPSFIPNESRHVVIDSTGFKIFGEGEWKVRLHGNEKRRTWRKWHLGIDESTQEIVASIVTTNDIKDSQVLGELLEQVDESINQVSADGAYDSFECDQQILERQAEPVIPPRTDAVVRDESEEHPEISARNQVVRKVKEQAKFGKKKVLITVALWLKQLCLE